MIKGKLKNRFKKGAASFYVVAFSTLILVIIAASFAAIIISEIARTSNDDLAQSAYDSALAGVEDAKVAIYNYRNCIEQGFTASANIDDDGVLTCGEIIKYVESDEKSCDMVAKILNRSITSVDDDGDMGVFISEKSDGNNNNMRQSYTCVKISTKLSDYRSTLSSANPIKIVPVKLDGKNASDIKAVRISWFSDSDSALVKYLNFKNSRVLFPALTLGASAPPTISVTLVQTAGTFSFSHFDNTIGDRTDRGTIFLVPTNDYARAIAEPLSPATYVRAYNTDRSENYINKNAFLKSNDKTAKNLPYLAYCNNDSGNEFLCSATLQLPEPVDGDRNNDTFLFAVSLPYGRPATSFAMEFCDSNDGCVTKVIADDGSESTESHVVHLDGVQVGVDSTGRANDLFIRVETRLESTDAAFPYPLYALQLLGDDNTSLLKKDLKTICEWNFPERGC